MVEATVSGVLSIEGKILLVRHTYGVAKDRILLPGGHVKPGEMAEEAVSREILEETGVLARPLGLIGTRIKKDEWLLLYRMQYVSGTPVTDGYENSEVLLLSPEEAVKREDIMPLSRELCRAVGRETVIEFPYNPDLKFQGIPDVEYMIYGF
ncbi:MAG: NUDIX hydrolase [Eubacterium sp.]|nr:NUDIX hydrolase [Eubacterium sp.]